MLVTVIADASYCPEHRVAGYGYWIASDRGKHGGSGEMRQLVVHNVAAEMMAVANALHEGLRLALVQAGDHVLLQTDCMPAIDAFEGLRKKLVLQEHDVIAHVDTLRNRFNLDLKFRHVRGHTFRQEARYVTSNMCDQRAREAMRKARGRIKIKQLKEAIQ